MPEEHQLAGTIDVNLTNVDEGNGAPAVAEDKTADAAATALATGLTLLTAGLGVFGGLTGAVARMARNHQTLTGVAVAFVLASVVLALASRLFRSDTRLIHGTQGWLAYRFFLWLSLICFVVGLSMAMLTLNDSFGEEDRPSIAATTSRAEDGTVTISGVAKAGGLEAGDKMHVFMHALSADRKRSEQVYYSLVGPSQDGLVEHSFSVILDPKIDAVVVTVGRAGTGTCVPPHSAGESEAPSKSKGDAVKPPNDLTACSLVSIGDPPPQATPTKTPSATGAPRG